MTDVVAKYLGLIYAIIFFLLGAICQSPRDTEICPFDDMILVKYGDIKQCYPRSAKIEGVVLIDRYNGFVESYNPNVYNASTNVSPVRGIEDPDWAASYFAYSVGVVALVSAVVCL